MEAKFVEGLKAGIIGGIVLALGIVIRYFTDIAYSWVDMPVLLATLGCCIWLILIAVMLLAGVLAVYMAARFLASTGDAIKVSAFAGLVAGAIGMLARMSMSILSPWVSKDTILYSDYPIAGKLSESLIGTMANLCSCGPTILIVCVAFAAVGGALYAAIALKLH